MSTARESPRILFVDDEPNILKAFEALLRKYRHRATIEFAVGGEAAISLLQKSAYDVVVSDLRMPGVDGLVLLRHLRDHYPETIRILLSGAAELESILTLSSYAHQSIAKPCEREVVEALLDRACILRELVSDLAVRRAMGRLRAVPTLPRTYQRLTAVLDDDRSRLSDVADVIESDISVSASALRLANSAFFGVGRPITSVFSAVQVLGVETVKAIVLEEGLFDRGRLPVNLHPFAERVHEHSQLVGGVAASLAGRAARHEAFAAGMLHDIGRILVAIGSNAEVPDEGPEHAKLGAYLLALWGLPLPLVDAVRLHHEDDAHGVGRLLHDAEEIAKHVVGEGRPTTAAIDEMHRMARDRAAAAASDRPRGEPV